MNCCGNRNISLIKKSTELKIYQTHSRNEQVFETVLTILGIKDLSLICETTLLNNVGMDFCKQYEIKKILQQNFGVKLCDQDIETMTIGKIYELSMEVQQFQNHLNRINKNEENHLTDFKYFISLAEDGIRTEYFDTIFYEIQSKSSNLDDNRCAILLPGLDGDVSHYANMAYDFSFSTFIVKYGNIDLSVKFLALKILKDIEKLCQKRNSFQLIGHSFGSLVAIELARELEGVNKNVKIVCIDGSPLVFKWMLNSSTYEFQGEILEVEVATRIAQKIHPTTLPNIFRHKLKSFISWDRKVECLIDLTRTLNFNIPEDNFKNVCKGLFNRTYAAATYEFERNAPIRAPITLIKPSEVAFSHISYDYGLELVTNGLVDVKKLQGNHYTIFQNSEIFNIINELNF